MGRTQKESVALYVKGWDYLRGPQFLSRGLKAPSDSRWTLSETGKVQQPCRLQRKVQALRQVQG